MIDECRDAFNLFDTDGDGHIVITELAPAFHALGYNPSDEQLTKMRNNVVGDMIDFVKFVELLLPMTFDADLEAELKEAFSAFDEDETGLIDASTLRHLIANIAPALDDDEIDALLS